MMNDIILMIEIKLTVLRMNFLIIDRLARMYNRTVILNRKKIYANFL